MATTKKKDEKKKEVKKKPAAKKTTKAITTAVNPTAVMIPPEQHKEIMVKDESAKAIVPVKEKSKVEENPQGHYQLCQTTSRRPIPSRLESPCL